MTETEVNKLLVLMRSAYPQLRIEVTSEMLLVYSHALRHFQSAEVYTAAYKHIAESPYFPTVSCLLKQVSRSSVNAPSAEESWGLVMDQVRSNGYYRDWKFDCDLIERAVSAIGKKEICHSESIGVERAHFFRLYDSYRDEEMRRIREAKLLGKECRAVGSSPPVPEFPSVADRVNLLQDRIHVDSGVVRAAKSFKEPK